MTASKYMKLEGLLEKMGEDVRNSSHKKVKNWKKLSKRTKEGHYKSTNYSPQIGKHLFL